MRLIKDEFDVFRSGFRFALTHFWDPWHFDHSLISKLIMPTLTMCKVDYVSSVSLLGAMWELSMPNDNDSTNHVVVGLNHTQFDKSLEMEKGLAKVQGDQKGPETRRVLGHVESIYNTEILQQNIRLKDDGRCCLWTTLWGVTKLPSFRTKLKSSFVFESEFVQWIMLSLERRTVWRGQPLKLLGPDLFVTFWLKVLRSWYLAELLEWESLLKAHWTAGGLVSSLDLLITHQQRSKTVGSWIYKDGIRLASMAPSSLSVESPIKPWIIYPLFYPMLKTRSMGTPWSRFRSMRPVRRGLVPQGHGLGRWWLLGASKRVEALRRDSLRHGDSMDGIYAIGAPLAKVRRGDTLM